MLKNGDQNAWPVDSCSNSTKNMLRNYEQAFAYCKDLTDSKTLNLYECTDGNRDTNLNFKPINLNKIW